MTTPFGRAVELVTEKASNESFKIGLEAIEPLTGRLVSQPVTDYEGDGIAFRSGDLLFGKLRPYLAKAWLADRDGAAVGEFHIYRPSTSACPRYIRWVLLSRSFLDPVESSVFGAKMPRVDWEFIRTVPVHLPALDEQKAIADYLDRETARIDTLIEEQQRLTGMLHERRQAAIDTAYAELAAPYGQLRRSISFLTSGSRGWGDYYAESGDRFLRIGNLPRTNLDIGGNAQFVKLPPDVTEGARTKLHEGDLLFSITAYLGSVAVVDGDWIGAYVSQHVALCRLNQHRLHPKFVGWWMLTTAGQNQLKVGAAGGTKVQLALDDIKNLRVPMPDVGEQYRIAAHIEEETAKIDETITETERFIELSKERRAALITAAVTGQIDVRDAVA